MNGIIRLTLDTNIFSKHDISLVGLLIDYQRKGLVQLFITSTVIEELTQIPDENWREQALAMAREAKELTDLENTELLDKVFEAVFPGINPKQAKYPKRRKDALILAQHIQSHLDYFVTRDRHFLQHRDKLHKLYKCKINSPEEIRNKL